MFKFNPFRSSVMLFEVTGTNLDPVSSAIVSAQLRKGGQPVEAQFTNRLTVHDVAIGDGVIGLDLAATALTAGQYQICVRAEGLEALDCVPFDLIVEAPSPCEAAFATAKAANPTFGCRCKSGSVKRAAADAPDGTLGSFTAAAGGNTMGPYDHGNMNTDAKVTSIAKFEPHFLVEILNDPGRPAACDKEEWERLSVGLCSEGQNINRTFTTKIGAADEHKTSTDPNTGAEVIYDPRPAAAMRKDGWGYDRPADSGHGSVTGKAKAHDAPNIVHWLDAPGAHARASATLKALAPAKKEHYFQSYVHGTTGKKEDNCDCFFSVTSVVLNADGSVGASSIGAPDCQ